MIERPSPNHGPRRGGRRVDMLVLHYTGMRTAAEALERLCDPEAQVSAHYLIDENGAVYRLVDEERRAWHAGVASWRGDDDVNSRSVGIELVNPGHEFGYRDFPEPQLETLEALAHDILRRHPIPARNVVGHSDVAPGRKQDPGELFPWDRLARLGIGLFPAAAVPHVLSPAQAARLLADYGYGLGDTADAAGLAPTVAAFQRHFRPRRVDGRVDADTAGRLAALVELAAVELA